MSTYNKLILWTIALSFLIPIGAGHGIGVLGLIEIQSLEDFNADYWKLTFIGSYDDRLFTSAIIALVGQLLLLISCFVKKQKLKVTLVYVGASILLLSFFVLIKSLSIGTHDKLVDM